MWGCDKGYICGVATRGVTFSEGHLEILGVPRALWLVLVVGLSYHSSITKDGRWVFRGVLVDVGEYESV